MIETRDLTKMYGDLYALNRLTIKLERGDVYGFIGPNGAGKTTTMRILATLLNPTWGEATVCGYSIYNGAKEIRRMMGYMPDFFGVYDDVQSAIRQVRQHTVLSISVANGLNNMAKDLLEGHVDILSVELRDGDALQVTLNDSVHDGSFIADLLIKNGFKLTMLKEEEIDL